MQIDSDLLNKLEFLSSLKIDESKKDETKTQLNEIINFINNLKELELNLDDISSEQNDLQTLLREDIPHQNSETIDMILQNAPKKDGRFFSVPSIIE